MKLTTLEAIGRALARTDVSYLVAGGVAVNAHDQQRLTHDLDLVPVTRRRVFSVTSESCSAMRAPLR